MDGKPVSKMFADELDDLIKKYHDSGIESDQVIGMLDSAKFNLQAEIRETVIREERPF